MLEIAASSRGPADRVGRAAFITTLIGVVAIALPVIWRGAPLGDDFNNCLAPIEKGLGGFFSASWDRLGVIRSARFVEILLTTGVCQSLPFGIAIAVPLVLTVFVAFLARGLLRDLRTPQPWPDVAAAMWLLQPLGTEASLWPAALHVPLGLALALLALRLHVRGQHWWAAASTIGAALSVEQTILAVPMALWLIAPAAERRRATSISVTVAIIVLIAFALWPGVDPRLRVGLAERIRALATDVRFYAGFPAVGLGLHSIPLAVWWALPWSMLALSGGAVFGTMAAQRLPDVGASTSTRLPRWLVAVALLLALANAPVLMSVPHQGSPRVFAPTWLLLVVATAMLAASLDWHQRRRLLFGAAAGLFAAGALLSQAFSVWVRVNSAEFTERAAHVLATKVPDGGKVAVCGVRRTVVTPAPRGAFAVHDLLYDWAAARALTYYTGQRATFRLAGESWDHPCPRATEVDVIVAFDDLLAATRR